MRCERRRGGPRRARAVRHGFGGRPILPHQRSASVLSRLRATARRRSGPIYRHREMAGSRPVSRSALGTRHSALGTWRSRLRADTRRASDSWRGEGVVSRLGDDYSAVDNNGRAQLAEQNGERRLMWRARPARHGSEENGGDGAAMVLAIPGTAVDTAHCGCRCSHQPITYFTYRLT